MWSRRRTVRRSDEVVLIDRYGTNVLSWVDERTAPSARPAPDRTGFESNPYDYLELEDGRAYIARFGENERAGEQPFDEGGDLLVLDPRRPEILGRVALRAEGDPLPRPPRGARPHRRPCMGLARQTIDRFQDSG